MRLTDQINERLNLCKQTFREWAQLIKLFVSMKLIVLYGRIAINCVLAPCLISLLFFSTESLQQIIIHQFL